MFQLTLPMRFGAVSLRLAPGLSSYPWTRPALSVIRLPIARNGLLARSRISQTNSDRVAWLRRGERLDDGDFCSSVEDGGGREHAAYDGRPRLQRRADGRRQQAQGKSSNAM